jgi:glutamate N-acetyltransferase/amino-acid N-acetyltransferase
VAADFGANKIPKSPIFIPDGPWTVLEEGGVCTPKGFKASGLWAGLRSSGTRPDISLFVSDTPAVYGGAFTLNVMCAAPVTYCKNIMEEKDTVRAVVINAGQANAATGTQGWEDCLACAAAMAKELEVHSKDVLIESTGVIGKRIKMEEYMAAMPKLVAALGDTDAAGLDAATGITTTDLASKSTAVKVSIGGTEITIGGCAKGSGMIHPNMATMLGVLTCDAAVDPALWRDIMRFGSIKSFNQITVDGDTSTNDAVLGLANGAAGGAVISDAASPEAQLLKEAVTVVLQALAKCIAWDGEGATVLLECEVTGASSDAAADIMAKSVVGSSLVKSAIFGRDPNWGRIAAAVGYSGVTDWNQNDLCVSLGDTELMKDGQPLPFDPKVPSTYMKEQGDQHGTVQVKVSVGDGPGRGMAWGCDLSYDYVKINAEYHT